MTTKHELLFKISQLQEELTTIKSIEQQMNPIRLDAEASIAQLQQEVHLNARGKGFYDQLDQTIDPRINLLPDTAVTFIQTLWNSSRLALIHSEVSEWLEAIRKPGRSEHCPELSKEAEEAADVVIRVMDHCEYMGINLGRAIRIKHAFNMNQEPMHGGKKL